MQKFMMWIAMGFVTVSVSALIANAASTVPPIHSPQSIPVYAGFADIRATKNHFIIVGDTQNTSHWEFWRERNERERKLIIYEITTSEPAFVVHLGI
jgi:hypothetical protein